MHVLFRYCESPHVRPANAFAYGIRSAVVGIHRCHVLCKIRLPVVVANEKTISRKGGQSKTHTQKKENVSMKTRRRKKKKEEKEDRERERGWKGRLLVTYQPSVRPVGPLLLHRKLEGRPLPREQSHEEEEGEAKRGHEVDTRRGRHGGRLVSLRLQSAAPQKSKSFFLLRRFLFLSFSDSFMTLHFRPTLHSFSLSLPPFFESVPRGRKIEKRGKRENLL